MGEPQVQQGDTLNGKYHLDRLLGEGGMGEVYRATNVAIDKVVAIKLLREEFADRKDVVERFLREAKAANIVRHRNVVEVLDIGRTERGVPYIVQEYLEGEDFSSMLESFPDGVPPGIAIGVLIPIVEAVAAAHAKGVVHRDLKPENVFLAKQDGVTVPKVLDFGISKLPEEGAQSTRLTGTHSIMGSPQYMSPEQIQTPQAVDLRSDIWSLGIMLFECLSGRLPFDGSTPEALFVKICRDEPLHLEDVAPHLPVEFSHMIARCLQQDPANRYQSAVELSDEFKKLRNRLTDVSGKDRGRVGGERGPVKPDTVFGKVDTRAAAPPEPGATAHGNAQASKRSQKATTNEAFAKTVAATEISEEVKQHIASGARPKGDGETLNEYGDQAESFAQKATAAQDPNRTRAARRKKAPTRPAPEPPSDGHSKKTTRGVKAPVKKARAEEQARAEEPAKSRGRERGRQGAKRAAKKPTPFGNGAEGTGSKPSSYLRRAPVSEGFDMEGMIDGIQAAFVVVGITLMVPLLSDRGLNAAVTAMGAKLAYAALTFAAVLAFACYRTFRLGVDGRSLSLVSAGLSLALVSGGLGVLGVALGWPDSVSADQLSMALGGLPWAVMVVCLGYVFFGLRRAQEELMSHGRNRTAYGAFVLAMSIFGMVASYRVVKHIAFPDEAEAASALVVGEPDDGI